MAQKEENGFGIAGLTLSIVGLFIFGPFFGTLGIIFSAIGMGKNQKYSKVGLVIGIIDWIWFFISLFFFATLFAQAFGSLF